MTDIKGEILLRTKPGCYMAVRLPPTGDKTFGEVIFGELSHFYPDSDLIEMSRYARLDLNNYKITEVVKDHPLKIAAKPESVLLGKSLISHVGGEEKANELLDSLGHQFSSTKYKEYVGIMKKQKREEKLEEKRRDAELRKALRKDNWRDLKDVGVDIGKVFGYYLHGHFPWLYKSFPQKDRPGKYIFGIRNDWAAGANAAVTAYIDFMILVLGGSGYIEAVGAKNVPPFDPHITVPLMMALVPTVGIATKAVIGGAKTVKKKYDEWQEKEERRRRQERLRQAFCPADSEKYYDV